MENLNKYIDHTLLSPIASLQDIIKLCNEAKQYDFASVCINPKFIPLAKAQLKNTRVKVCTVVGFPLGSTSLKVKIFEAKEAIKDGADEVDMVLNIGALIDGDYQTVLEEIKSIRSVTKDKILKVILENCYLTKEKIVKGCQLCVDAGVDFVKTSTGFGSSGATTEDVELMSRTVNNKIKVKASGGIRSKDDAIKLIVAGAERIGTSGGVKIVQNLKNIESY